MKQPVTIVYPVPEALPDPRARFIQIVNTCSALAQSGVQVILICGGGKGATRDEILSFYGIPDHENLVIQPLPMLRRAGVGHFSVSWHGVFQISLLAHLMRERSYRKAWTVLFVRHLKLAAFLLKWKRLIPFPMIFEVHEIFHLTTVKKKKRDLLKALEEHVYHRADAIVAISHAIEDFLVAMNIPESSIHVIHNGIKKEWFDLHSRTSPSYICYTGSLYAWKGVDTVIAAMRYLPGEKLLIVGGGSRLDELKSLAAREGVSDRVVFAGPVPHSAIPHYLSQAKITILPNVPDGPTEFSSPLKLFEYMASGIPIVATDIPVFREILSDRVNAMICKPNNPETLASCIDEIVHNRGMAAELGRNAKELAINYTYEKRAEKILSVIDGILPQA